MLYKASTVDAESNPLQAAKTRPHAIIHSNVHVAKHPQYTTVVAGLYLEFSRVEQVCFKC